MPTPPWKVALLVAAAIAMLGRHSMACDSPECACASHQVTQSRQGAWSIALSPSFQVCSLTSAAEAERVARRCEHVRRELAETWGLADVGQAWTPKCQVILHPTTADYAVAVGPHFAATYGSSLVKPQVGRITARRIDLRTDVDDYLTAALPHELCHVLLADRFRTQPAPLWYDEGIALLADTEAKQRLHDRDLRDGVRRQIDFSLPELVSADNYPATERMGVFYGQCADLTRFLRQVGTAEQLHQFAIRSAEVGVNLAARECYAYEGAQELEHQWRERVTAGRKATTAHVLPVSSTGRPARGQPL
jgi:hypothetical protein